MVAKIKQEFKDQKMLIAVAGGIRPNSAPEALESGADIIIVGRYITQSRDFERATREFVRILAETAPKDPGDVDLFRVHTE